MAMDRILVEGRPILMPHIGEPVWWYKNGRKDGNGWVCICTEIYKDRGTICINTLSNAYGVPTVKDGIPHVTDSRLLNPDYASDVGGWELLDWNINLRRFASRLEDLEAVVFADKKKKNPIFAKEEGVTQAQA